LKSIYDCHTWTSSDTVVDLWQDPHWGWLFLDMLKLEEGKRGVLTGNILRIPPYYVVIVGEVIN